MFDPPPDLDSDLEGDSGKAECSWERTPEGKICITAVNGVSVGPNADRESKKPDDEASEGESESGDKMGDETGE